MVLVFVQVKKCFSRKGAKAQRKQFKKRDSALRLGAFA
jgi:hypothetical protein